MFFFFYNLEKLFDSISFSFNTHGIIIEEKQSCGQFNEKLFEKYIILPRIFHIPIYFLIYIKACEAY